MTDEPRAAVGIPSQVSRRMSLTRGRDTAPELAVRRVLHSRGFRYRVNHRPEPGVRRTADIVFTRARVAVFVDGCFWHRCPEHYRPATTRGTFWARKIDGNVERDKDTNERLTEAGWRVLRFWEHEDPERIADRIQKALGVQG